MSCIKLRQGQDATCKNYARKFYQQVVLINKADVEQHLILTPQTSQNQQHNDRYRIAFNLFKNKKGFRFSAPENSNTVFGTFSKSIKEGIPQYKHTIQLPLFGVSQESMCVLNQLDYSDYFGALQYYNGTVLIFGFENGLTTSNYDFDPANNAGGTIIILESNANEDDTPYVYFNQTNTEEKDFDNDFENINTLWLGDFNNDFNSDFYIN